MASFRTFVRAVIMVATLAAVVKAWRLYGPSAGEMRAISQRVVEVADEWWSHYRQPQATTTPAAPDPRLQAAPIASQLRIPPAREQQPVRLATAEIAVGGSAQSVAGAQQAVALAPAASFPTAPRARVSDVVASAVTAAPPNDAARLRAVSERLSQLGVLDQQLQPWGREGRLYRFTCRASWVDAPNYNRHFEAVAADPLAAIEQVAAEVGAWRTAQRGSAQRL